MYYHQHEQCSHTEPYDPMISMLPPHPLPFSHTTTHTTHQHRLSSSPPSAAIISNQHPSYIMSDPMSWHMDPMGSSTTCLPSHHEMNDPVSPSYCVPPPPLSLQQDSFYAAMASSFSDFASPLDDPLYGHISSPPTLKSLSTTKDHHYQVILYPSSSSSPSSLSSCMSPMPSPQDDTLLLLQHCQQPATIITAPTFSSPSSPPPSPQSSYTAGDPALDVQGRSFQCLICSRAFKRKHDLQRHVRVHTGDKPYSCLCCKKAFARTDALKRHLRMEEACRTSPVIQAMKCAGKRRYRNL